MKQFRNRSNNIVIKILSTDNVGKFNLRAKTALMEDNKSEDANEIKGRVKRNL